MLSVNDWDDGAALFAKLQNNDFFTWDIRDQFSVSRVEEILVELSLLEPTKFISISYVSLLLDKALFRSKVSISTAVLDPQFALFAEYLRSYKEELDSYAKPKLDAFIENIQDGMKLLCGSHIIFRDESHSSREVQATQIYREEIPLLARDAVIATKIPLHWIYNNNQGGGLGKLFKVLHSDILLFASLYELELSIHRHELTYGFRYVTINSGGGSLHSIVYTSPDSAFIMSELSWDSHGSKMVGKSMAYSYHLDGLDMVRSHFPNLDKNNKLTVDKSEYQVIGSIKACCDKSKVWLLMLTELMSLKLDSLCIAPPKISIKLLSAVGSNKLLPVKINIPFTLEHKDIATVAREIGVEESPLKSELWSIVDSLSLDNLLPRDGKLYFNVRTAERTESLNLREKYDQEFRNAFVTLYPYPDGHFGAKESTSDAINFVLAKNLAAIINAKLEDQWFLDFKNQKEWLESMLKKRQSHIAKNVRCWHEKEREQSENTINFNQYLATGVYENCRRLAIKLNTKKLSNISAIGLPALYKKNRKKEVLGIVTGNEFNDEEGCDYFIIVPNSTDELMEIFKCTEAELPTLFQGWKRWKNHGKIAYPWRYERGYSLNIAAFKVYY